MKVSFPVALAAIAAASASASNLSENQYQFLFSRYVDTYNKTYETSSFFTKYNTFKSNLDTILAHNAKEDKTFTMALNQFADLTSEEFGALNTLGKNVYVPKSEVIMSAPCPFEAAHGAQNVDWRSKMNAVKNQASCGSCWAFAAVAGIEGAYSISKGQKVDLSEQQLVDCDRNSSGCNGGLMSYAYSYLESSGGACLSSDYPYTARNGTCRSCPGKVKVASHSAGISSEAGLVSAIQQQPIPVALAASSSAFQFYSRGVVKASECGSGVNHGVTAVGLGSENGTDYYLIRNSWGATWGDAGHIKIERNKNACGIVSTAFATYPKVY